MQPTTEVYFPKISAEILSKLSTELDKAIAIDKADYGNIQIFDEASNKLFLIVHKGFSDDFVQRFREVAAFDPTACGRAIGLGSPIFIEDLLTDVSSSQFLDVMKYRSVKSMPIYSRDKKKLGVISTHFKEKPKGIKLNSLNKVIREIAKSLQKVRS